MKVTIKDIARECNVNMSTVSRVINGDTRISQATVDQVQAKIEEMGYKPLRKRIKLNKNIILALPNMDIYTLGETIGYLSKKLNDSNYDMLLVNLKGIRDITPEIGKNLCGKKPEGIILYGCSVSKEAADIFIKAGIPTLVRHGLSQNLITISVNNYNGVQVGTRYLIERGYKKIGFIGWNPKDHNCITRHNSFINVLNEFKLDSSLYQASSLDSKGGYDSTKLMIEKHQPEAIFYGADILAYGGIDYLSDHQISYPDDIGIIGFDDARLSHSLGLTSLNEHIMETADLVMENLLTMINNGKFLPPREINLTPELVVRRSLK